jgi:hypothetical protein
MGFRGHYVARSPPAEAARRTTAGLGIDLVQHRDNPICEVRVVEIAMTPSPSAEGFWAVDAAA